MVSFENFFIRLAEVEKEGLASASVNADAVPYFFHQQERYPYWTNRIGETTVTSDGEEYDVYSVQVIARLVMAQVTDGIVRGDNEARLQMYIPLMLKWFNEHELAQSATYPTPIDDLVRVRVDSCRGYTEFQPSGQIGTEFTLIVEFEQQLTQAYL